MGKELDYSNDKKYIPYLLSEIKKIDEGIYIRVEHQLLFWSEKAIIHKRIYNICSLLGVIFPAMAAILNFWPGTEITIQSCLSSVFSILATLSAALISVSKSKGHWRAYRAGCEKGKTELSKYLMNIKPYDKSAEENTTLFLERFENIVGEVGGQWMDNTKERE